MKEFKEIQKLQASRPDPVFTVTQQNNSFIFSLLFFPLSITITPSLSLSLSFSVGNVIDVEFIPSGGFNKR